MCFCRQWPGQRAGSERLEGRSLSQSLSSGCGVSTDRLGVDGALGQEEGRAFRSPKPGVRTLDLLLLPWVFGQILYPSLASVLTLSKEESELASYLWCWLLGCNIQSRIRTFKNSAAHRKNVTVCYSALFDQKSRYVGTPAVCQGQGERQSSSLQEESVLFTPVGQAMAN